MNNGDANFNKLCFVFGSTFGITLASVYQQFSEVLRNIERFNEETKSVYKEALNKYSE